MKQLRKVYLPARRHSKRIQRAETQADAQSAAREQFWQDRRLYDLAPIAFFTLDRQGRIRELNDHAARLLAFPATWLVKRPFLVFVANHDISRFLSSLMRSGHQPEQTILELDLIVEKRLIPVQISLMTIVRASGEAIVHQMAIVDLTEIKKTENQLEKSVAQWTSLVRNAPDTIMTLDRSGKIVFANMPVWGYSTSALTGTRIFDYVPKAEKTKLKRCLAQVFKSRARSHCEIALARGKVKSWFTFSFGPASKLATQIMMTTTILIRDISEQKRGEEMLRASREQLRDFAARIDAVREEERTRIARELHDELGQALTILKLDLSWVSGRLRDAGVRKKMKGMIVHVDDTIQRVRRLSSELRPSILDDLGLGPAIEWQAAEIQKRTGIRTEVLAGPESDDFPKEVAAAIFRVVQEALTNVVRHAEAKKVRISLKSEDYGLRISIEDNGKGMTTEQVSNAKSLGLVGMKERVARLGGEFNIYSEPAKGTRLDIIIPTHHD